MSDTAIVPLPENLSHCGCRHAPTRHATTCAVAIAFDDTPLKDRPEYVESDGKSNRFAAISWDFPLTLHMTVNVEVQLDPVAIITLHADEYRAFELDHEYEGWEKPIVFLNSLVEDQSDFGGVWFGSRRLCRDDSFVEFSEEHPTWTSEDTDRLDAVLAAVPVVDPNQSALDV